MSKWPKYRIVGSEGSYKVEIAWCRTHIIFGGSHWLSRPFGLTYRTVEEAREFVEEHKKRTEKESTVVCVIE